MQTNLKRADNNVRHFSDIFIEKRQIFSQHNVYFFEIYQFTGRKRTDFAARSTIDVDMFTIDGDRLSF